MNTNEIINLFFSIYFLIGLFGAMLTDSGYTDDSGKRLMRAWSITIFWPIFWIKNMLNDHHKVF